MRKLISFMHVSLDGFVTGPGGEMDWIIIDEEIFKDSISFAATTDTVLYGRKTYEMMSGYWPGVLTNPNSTALELHYAEWIENIHKIVFSKTLKKAEWNNTRLIKENIVEKVPLLKQQDGKSMMIFGSPSLTHSFMQMNLIDEYRINVNPVVLGKGVPLFKNIDHMIDLKLLKTKKFNSGVVGFYYKQKIITTNN